MKLIYTLAELKAMPNLGDSHYDDLKVDTGIADPNRIRIWLSRMSKEDGAPYDNQVTIEQWDGDKWVIVKQYRAR